MNLIQIFETPTARKRIGVRTLLTNRFGEHSTRTWFSEFNTVNSAVQMIKKNHKHTIVISCND